MRKSELRQIIREEIKRTINEIGINNKYVIVAGGSYKINTKEASKYLKQFNDEDKEIDAVRFISDRDWKEFETLLSNIENMSEKELEDEMRKAMSYYYYGN